MLRSLCRAGRCMGEADTCKQGMVGLSAILYPEGDKLLARSPWHKPTKYFDCNQLISEALESASSIMEEEQYAGWLELHRDNFIAVKLSTSILLAFVDADYKFIGFSVGANGLLRPSFFRLLGSDCRRRGPSSSTADLSTFFEASCQ